MVEPAKANQIGEAVKAIVQKATYDANRSSIALSRSAVNGVNARAVSSSNSTNSTSTGRD